MWSALLPSEVDGFPLRNEPHLPQTISVSLLNRDGVVEARVRFRRECLSIFLGPEQGNDFVVHRQCALSEKGFEAANNPIHPVRVPLLEGLLRPGPFPEPVENESETLALRRRPVIAFARHLQKFFRGLHSYFQTRFCFALPP